jgi:hypothetical protein
MPAASGDQRREGASGEENMSKAYKAAQNFLIEHRADPTTASEQFR